MSILARIGRALQRPRRVPVDGAVAYGAAGERMTRDVLEDTGYHVCFNPIVPHPEKPGRFLETDAIVYGEGSLFCVESKRYRGDLAWSYKKDGKRNLVKHKAGNYGEGIFEKSYPDPLAKTKFFISCLKRALAEEDERFGRLYFHPVVAFAGDEGEISGVCSFEEGYVALPELPEFIYSRRNERFSSRRSRWIADGLEKLASWDVVIGRDGQRHYGTLVGEGLSLRKGSGEKQEVPYADTESLHISPGGRFSAADGVKVVNGSSEVLELRSSFASVQLDDFDSIRTHRLRDVSRIEVGTRRYRQRAGALIRE